MRAAAHIAHFGVLNCDSQVVERFLAGARSIDRNFMHAPPRKNLALILGLIVRSLIAGLRTTSCLMIVSSVLCAGNVSLARHVPPTPLSPLSNSLVPVSVSRWTSTQCAALPFALIRQGVWNSTFLGHACRALACYSEALADFAQHIQQVDMEVGHNRTVHAFGHSCAICVCPVQSLIW